MPHPIQSLIGAANTALGIAEDIGGFLAGPQPSDAGGRALQAAGRSACRSWANLPAWVTLSPNGGYLGMTRACTPYLDGEGFTPPVLPPGVRGGQCPTAYQVDGFVRATDADGVVVVETPINNTGIGPFAIREESTPSFRGLTLEDSTPANIANIGSSDLTLTLAIEPVFTRLDGGPDDCGDGTGTMPGTNPPPNPVYPPGQEPVIDPDGGVRIPIPPIPNPFDPSNPIVPPPIYIPPPADEFPDSPPPTNPDGEPGSPDNVRPPAGGGTGGEDGENVDFDEPPQGSVWVGAAITLTVDSRYGNIAGTGTGNTVYPRVLGNTSLICDNVRTTSERMLSRFHTIVRPTTALEVTGVFVSAIPGVTYSVRPIAQTQCSDVECDED